MILDIHDYPPLDLSLADESDGIKKAVLCESEEEAVWLLAAMKVQYPNESVLWTFPCTMWRTHLVEEYNQTCYNLGIGSEGRMTYGEQGYFLEKGYEIIPFYALTSGDRCFSQSNMPIESLFT